MSIIQVITFANIKKIIGKKQFTMEAESVKDLLDKLLEEYGEELKDELFDELGKIRSFRDHPIDVSIKAVISTPIPFNERVSPSGKPSIASSNIPFG